MAKTVKVSIVVDDDGSMRLTEKSAQRLGGKIDQLGKSAQTTDRQLKGVAQASANGSKNFAKQAQGISSGIVPVYAALAAQIFAIGAAFRFLKDAGDLASLREGQTAYSSATGVALASLTENIIKATEAQVSFRDAAQAAAIGTASGLSPKQLEKLGTAAKDVSLILGRDVTDSFNRLVRGVTKAEPELLDELGIVLRLKDATETYARSLGKNAEELNAFERSQAVANDVLAQTEQKYSRIVEITKPSINTFNQFGKAFDDIVNGIKTAANFLLKPLANIAAFNPFATLLLAAPLLQKLISSIAPQISDLFGGINVGLDNFSKKLDKANTSLNIDLTQLGALKGDLSAANALADTAGDNILNLGKETKITAFGFKKLEKDGRLSLKTIDLNIRNASKGLFEYKGLSAETREAFVDNFKDMRVAVATLEGKTASSIARTSSRWALFWVELQRKAITTLQAVTLAVQKFANFFVKTLTRLASRVGILMFAIDLLPQGLKNFIKSSFGFEVIDKKVLALRESFEKTNEEFKKFVEVQKVLGENTQKIYENSLARVSAFGKVVRTQELDDELILIENYNKRIKEVNNTTLNLAKGLKKVGEALPSFSMTTEEANELFQVLRDEGGKAQTVLAEYINQRFEAIKSLKLQGKVVKEYRDSIAVLNNNLLKGNEIQKESITNYENSRKQLEAFIVTVEGFIKASESIRPKIQDAFKNLLSTNPLQDLSDEFAIQENLIFEINRGLNLNVSLRKDALDILKNMSSEDLKSFKTNLRNIDILREQLRIEQEITKSKINLQRRFTRLSKGATALQLKALSAEQKIDSLVLDRIRREKTLKNSIESKIVQGHKLTQQEREQLELAQQEIFLIEEQIQLLKKQEESAYRLGMAIKQGLENGLQTNIYDLITGDETSFSDAVLKTVKTSLEAAAKELSTQLTNDIIGGLFGKKETEDQKRNRELKESLEEGGLRVKRAIIEAFEESRENFKEFKKDPLSSTFGSQELREKEAALRIPNDVLSISTADVRNTAENLKRDSIDKLRDGTTREKALFVIPITDTLGGMGVRASGPGSIAAEGGIFPDSGVRANTDNKDEIIFTRDKGRDKYEDIVDNTTSAVASIESLEKISADSTKKAMDTSLTASKELEKGAFSLKSIVPMLMSVIGAGGSNVGDIIGGLFGAASGGIMPGGVTGYADGGIVKRPTLGLVGEGKMNEAVVPLPDGKAIPVSMNGSGQNNNVTVNVSMDGQGKPQEETHSNGQQGLDLGRVIAGAVQEELQRQKRPGGILSPYGAA